MVALDAAGRTLVIRNPSGVEEKVELADNLAGFGGVKAGDRVTLTLRAGLRWTRVSSIVQTRAVPTAPGTAASAPKRSTRTLLPEDIREIRRQYCMG